MTQIQHCSEVIFNLLKQEGLNPIGVSIGIEEDKRTWRIDFEPNAPDDDLIKAQNIINGFNYQEYINNTKYQNLRKAAYPDINSQLDMLWHAMDRGEINKATEWYDSIKAVKDKYPKPS